MHSTRASGAGWRAIFFANLPLGGLTFLLAHRYLPAERRAPGAARAGFDAVGTLTLAAYALAMTAGHGRFGALNVALLLVAVSGGGLFVLVEGKTTSPLIRLSMLRDPVLTGSLDFGCGPLEPGAYAKAFVALLAPTAGP